ncbi:MAG: ferredoxin, partial [Nocardioidaceae bacterium]
LLLPVVEVSSSGQQLLTRALVIATAGHLAMLAVEYGGRHATRGAAAAAHMITRGRYAQTFWFGAVAVAGLALVLAVFDWNGPVSAAAALAAVLVHPALLAYESVFVRAGQDVPLS